MQELYNLLCTVALLPGLGGTARLLCFVLCLLEVFGVNAGYGVDMLLWGTFGAHGGHVCDKIINNNNIIYTHTYEMKNAQSTSAQVFWRAQPAGELRCFD